MFWVKRTSELEMLRRSRDAWRDDYTRVRDENEALRKSLKELADLTKHFVEML